MSKYLHPVIGQTIHDVVAMVSPNDERTEVLIWLRSIGGGEEYARVGSFYLSVDAANALATELAQLVGDLRAEGAGS